ncbi:MAG: zinc ribbon domain-containing protein [Opitutus sp.]|nr:zinc ribbon domain-containing protein [Opitutus sp.]
MSPPKRSAGANRVPGPPDECANCGTSLRRDDRACPECGADERSGWRAESIYDGLDLPEEAFVEDGKDAHPAAKPRKKINGAPWYWWCVGIGVVVLFALGVLGRF